MHLKTLTLRGFKSFASATTLRFEPGITCVVGPNGSGKSNVVDALAWVMGEQGVKTLRGGKMEDVIFAGTTGTGGRPPLGRAEVSLTIDNADGALPIGYAEVTLTRTMFRSGGSEYAINGAPARLLDVQELLSDSGIGREMHVIVGQGQLDAVLHATPEDRRGFVEEAAGVLKHRKRKERALRKLESMQANLTRLSDLTAEVRRQLGPLARQADVARRAAVVAAEVRDARSRLLADDLVQATAALAADLADTQARADRRRAAAEELDAARGELAGAQEWAAQVAPRLVAAREAYYALQGVRERLRSTAAVAAERERHLRPLAHAPADSGRDVEALVADAVRAREDEGALADQVRAEGEALAVASGERTAAEAALAVHERALAAQARERADATERLAALGGQVSARRSRAEAARAEAERTLAAREAARERAEAAARRVAELTGSPAPHAATPFEGQSRATPAGEGRGSAASHDDSRANGGKGGGEGATEGQDAGEALADAEADLARWRAAEREAESDRAGAQARAEALEMALRERRDGTGALLDHGGHLPGVLGSFASLLQVRPGAQDVVAAALGAAAEAVAVESVADAVDALRLLRERTAGRAELVSASTVEPVPDGGRRARGRHGAAAAAVTGTGAGGVGAGQVDGEQAELAAFADHLSSLPGVGRARPLLSLVSAPPQLSAALARLLSDHVAVDGLAQARALVAVRPDLVAVTRGGDVLGAHGARGGSPGAAGGPPSRLHVQAALEQARSASAEAAGRAEHAREELARASASVASAREAVAAALAELQARDAAAAAAARVLGEATGTARAAAAEDQRLSVAARRASEAAEAETARHVEAVERLRAAEAEVAELLGLRAVGAPGGAPGDPGDPGDPGNAGAAGDLGDPGAADPQATSAALAAAAAAARAREVDARLALRTAEERLRGLAGRAEGLERRARAEQARVEASLARARRAATQLAAVVAVRTGADVALAVARQALLSAGLQRDDAEADAASSTDHLVAVRQRAEALAVTVEGLTDSVHRDELARAERSAHADALRERALQELGVDAEVLVEEFGPDRQVPVLEGTGTGGPQTVPYVRAEQEERLRRTERALAKLGTVNPLALEEFAALEERSAFLSRQLDDLRTARGDLMGIVAEVDERVQEVFAAAFADTAAEFEKIFARLFPGGEGALVLTDPDDLLTSGIDVEARPAGKRVKRLSLLSGGERSLTAVAILVAIFKARPSPFYVLDEVEAALDDTNLRRLLVVLEELRDASQLVVITHQERTMEVADALYGVSMRADGISAVVSQRLRSPEGEQPAAASGGATVDLREGAKADAPTG